jgi:hypothetical protein
MVKSGLSNSVHSTKYLVGRKSCQLVGHGQSWILGMFESHLNKIWSKSTPVQVPQATMHVALDVSIRRCTTLCEETIMLIIRMLTQQSFRCHSDVGRVREARTTADHEVVDDRVARGVVETWSFPRKQTTR